MLFQEMLNPLNGALALIDFQPAMFKGVQREDRKVIVDNVQFLARACSRLRQSSQDSFSGPFMPEVTEGIYPNKSVIDRTSISSWPNIANLTLDKLILKDGWS